MSSERLSFPWCSKRVALSSSKQAGWNLASFSRGQINPDLAALQGEAGSVDMGFNCNTELGRLYIGIPRYLRKEFSGDGTVSKQPDPLL